MRTAVEQTGPVEIWVEESHGESALDGVAVQLRLGCMMAHLPTMARMLTQVEDGVYVWALVEMVVG